MPRRRDDTPRDTRLDAAWQHSDGFACYQSSGRWTCSACSAPKRATDLLWRFKQGQPICTRCANTIRQGLDPSKLAGDDEGQQP